MGHGSHYHLKVETPVHPAALPVDELLKSCTVERTRRSGPGGQHRNKVETAVVLTHTPSGVQAEASERRSQPENQQVAEFRLRVKLAVEVRNLPQSGSPTDLWQSRCRNQRIHINPEHPDFPTLLAEALDVLAAADWQVPTAAETLQCSASQLLKLLQQAPPAFHLLNQHRRDRGQHPFKPAT